MNITQSYVSLFFWLGSCQLGLKVFHWEREFCLLLISAVFSILEVYIYLNSVLLVFLFSFLFFCCCFLFSRGQAWVFDFRNQSLARLLSINDHFNFKNSANKDTLRTFPSEGHFPWPSTEVMLILKRFLMDNVQPGTHAWSIFTPDFLILKEKKKSLRNHLAI